jgi:two-component system nitrogen regulation response regulator NtrX
VLNVVKEGHPDLPVVMISGHGNIETAVAAIKAGAYDFIEKPFKADRLVARGRAPSKPPPQGRGRDLGPSGQASRIAAHSSPQPCAPVECASADQRARLVTGAPGRQGAAARPSTPVARRRTPSW